MKLTSGIASVIVVGTMLVLATIGVNSIWQRKKATDEAVEFIKRYSIGTVAMKYAKDCEPQKCGGRPYEVWILFAATETSPATDVTVWAGGGLEPLLVREPPKVQ